MAEGQQYSSPVDRTDALVRAFTARFREESVAILIRAGWPEDEARDLVARMWGGSRDPSGAVQS